MRRWLHDRLNRHVYVDTWVGEPRDGGRPYQAQCACGSWVTAFRFDHPITLNPGESVSVVFPMKVKQ